MGVVQSEHLSVITKCVGNGFIRSERLCNHLDSLVANDSRAAFDPLTIQRTGQKAFPGGTHECVPYAITFVLTILSEHSGSLLSGRLIASPTGAWVVPVEGPRSCWMTDAVRNVIKKDCLTEGKIGV